MKIEKSTKNCKCSNVFRFFNKQIKYLFDYYAKTNIPHKKLYFEIKYICYDYIMLIDTKKIIEKGKLTSENWLLDHLFSVLHCDISPLRYTPPSPLRGKG